MARKLKLDDQVWEGMILPRKRKALIDNEIVDYHLCAESRNVYNEEGLKCIGFGDIYSIDEKFYPGDKKYYFFVKEESDLAV